MPHGEHERLRGVMHHLHLPALRLQARGDQAGEDAIVIGDQDFHRYAAAA
jgi:hypothetical protein